MYNSGYRQWHVILIPCLLSSSLVRSSTSDVEERLWVIVDLQLLKKLIYYVCLMAVFQDNLGKLASEWQNHSGFY